MRIVLLNNTNNILFSTARHLRDQGHDVTLFLMDNEMADGPHFHPSCDTFDLDYQNYTREVPWGTASRFSSYDMDTVARDLEPFDFFVGSGSAPAFVARAGRVLDVFIPFGGDLCEDAFRPPKFDRRSLRSLVAYPYWQRRGIVESRAVFADISPSYVEPALAKLGYKGKRVFASPPLPYAPLYTPEVLKARTAYWHPPGRLRERTDVLVTSPSRHIWKGASSTNWSKGTDKLIHAVAAVKKRRPSARVGIVFYEYGPDVAASRALVNELGLKDDVLWLPRSSRKDVMVNLTLTDFACGEYGPDSWYMGGVVAEVLCMGKPLFHRRDDALFSHLYPEMYPMIDVQRPDDIARALEGFLDSPEEYRDMGRRARLWFEKHIWGHSLEAFESLIERR
ncbi:MAG: hypothetical protein IPQ09_17855 [Myxococcales bacterium]|nr:hypothetical protein [Myxococcales bacterium]